MSVSQAQVRWCCVLLALASPCCLAPDAGHAATSGTAGAGEAAEQFAAIPASGPAALPPPFALPDTPSATTDRSVPAGGSRPAERLPAADGTVGSAAPFTATHRVLTVSVHDLHVDESTQSALAARFHQAIAAEASRLTGFTLPPQQAAAESLWLLRQPGVELETRQRRSPLSGRTLTVMQVRIPLDILEQWKQRLQERAASRQLTLIRGAVMTSLVWFLSLVVLALADRLTMGYRRGWLVPLTLGIPAVATLAGWWYVWRVELVGP